jgi:hypothetical protein
MLLLTQKTRAGTLLSVVLIGLLAVQSSSSAHEDSNEDDVLVAIAKYAVPTHDGSIVIRIHIACEPMWGFEEFQQGHAGGSQARTGAWSETGIDGTIVCDGQAHTHTARLYPFEGVFKRGGARANASVFICNLIGDEQFCVSGSSARKIVIRGTPVP